MESADTPRKNKSSARSCNNLPPERMGGGHMAQTYCPRQTV
jgi:hypothetical protein